ncbi:LysR family transcriptional regulator [Ascidiimonas aurantiaca]|uniref:LysR family transcriptional regulator n=1 Tax=Ascidiimonas aurantiaca TaxID=1685432 RepID=UPI0030EF666E
MDYTLHQLRIFLKIAQTKSITKAAEELHLTQPAVSIQLKKLQDQFEIPLTEIVGRKLYVTDFGNEIAIAGKRILDEVNAIKYKTLAYKGSLAGKLKLTIVSTAKYVMPYFLYGFIKNHEGVELEMDVTNRARVIRSLEANEVDFAMVSLLPEKLQIDKVSLFQNKLFLVGSTRFPFVEKMYEYDILESLPLIYREEGSATRLAMEQFIGDHKLSVVKKMELTSNEAVKQAVIAGLGYSIMPLIGIKNELQNNDLQIIPVQGFPIISDWNLIWLQNKKFSPVAASYLEHIKQEKSKIARENFEWFECY